LFADFVVALWEVVTAETQVEEDEEPDGGVGIVVPCVIALLTF
jgi:hypothetical protein